MSLLALRVEKTDPHEGHDHGPAQKPQKRTKGLWTVKIEQQQDVNPDLHYVWLYEGSQWRMKLYAVGALVAILAVVMFPLWPIKLRIGVWYLSMCMLGLLGLFFAMTIFRLILFCATVFTIPPGLWLYPNLFEDVGFFDSFRPVWGWQEVRTWLPPLFGNMLSLASQDKKKKSKKPKAENSGVMASESSNSSTTLAPTSNGNGSAVRRRDLKPRVEEVEED